MEINRGDESEIYKFKIAGVAAAMPGFMGKFARMVATANMGGVMISQDIYMSIMDIPPIPYLDKRPSIVFAPCSLACFNSSVCGGL